MTILRIFKKEELVGVWKHFYVKSERQTKREKTIKEKSKLDYKERTGTYKKGFRSQSLQEFENWIFSKLMVNISIWNSKQNLNWIFHWL